MQLPPTDLIARAAFPEMPADRLVCQSVSCFKLMVREVAPDPNPTGGPFHFPAELESRSLCVTVQGNSFKAWPEETPPLLIPKGTCSWTLNEVNKGHHHLRTADARVGIKASHTGSRVTLKPPNAGGGLLRTTLACLQTVLPSRGTQTWEISVPRGASTREGEPLAPERPEVGNTPNSVPSYQVSHYSPKGLLILSKHQLLSQEWPFSPSLPL